ncbi:MAG: PAC2 family protein [candidate division NC10 bacterium]|nr:PAC2 family protein [candidate division NC10 bacterium]
MPLIVEETPPPLRRPILLLAFAGWNDAAEVATTTAKLLCERWSARPFARLDPEEFYHFGLTRPFIRFKPGSTTEREIIWPANEFFYSQAPDLARDVIVGIGIEPHLRWRQYCQAILTLARQQQVTLVLTLGALLAEAPHTRPIRIIGSATDHELAARLRITPTRYEGPTGIVGVLSHISRQEGFPCASLWASVPHYVATTTNPRAILALAERIAEFLEWSADFSELEETAGQFDAQLADIMAKDPKIQAYIQALEARDLETGAPAPESVGELPSTGDLMKELEQFLRQHRPKPDQG